MKYRSRFGAAILPLASTALCAAVLLGACAGSEETAPEEPGIADTDSGKTSLPPSSGSDASTTADAGGGDAAKDAIADAKKDGSGNTGSAPTCAFDTLKLLTKIGEVGNAVPCDTSCNPTTHCCLKLVPGLPFDAGALLGTDVCVTK